MTDPRVLYVMPVFNAAHWVKDSVTSVLQQDYAPFDLLCVDDGSTDATPRILKEMAEQDSRVQVLTQANAGPGAAFNRGLAHAMAHRYPYVARMDADDHSLPGRTRLQIELMEHYPDTAACSGQAVYFTGQRDPCGTSQLPERPEQVRQDILRGGRGLIQGATLFRVSALAAVGGYRAEKTPAEDTDVFLRLSERYPLRNVPDIVYRIRICPDSHSLSSIQMTRFYHHYYLHLATLRAVNKPECSFQTFSESLGRGQRAAIHRESLAITAYFRWMTKRSVSSLISAALLDPSRTIQRIAKKLRIRRVSSAGVVL